MELRPDGPSLKFRRWQRTPICQVWSHQHIRRVLHGGRRLKRSRDYPPADHDLPLDPSHRNSFSGRSRSKRAVVTKPRKIARDRSAMSKETFNARHTGRVALLWLSAFGIDPRRFSRAASSFRGYWRGYRRIRHRTPKSIPLVLTPYLHDRCESAGTATGHYFWQDMLVARRVLHASPARHVDVGSRVDGLITHLLVFRDVEVVDVRPLPHTVPGLSFILDDATSLNSFVDRSVESVSSLHAIEHFGLGRYGDSINPQGHILGLRSLQRVLAPGGRLYLSFPIGAERVEYNGQRILAPTLPLEVLAELRLESFVAIPPSGPPRQDMSPHDLAGTSGWCGLYEFSRAL